MSRTFVFAGGGTGGHIYPGIAVAQKIRKLSRRSKILFYCSDREIDSRLLRQAGFEHRILPAVGLVPRPLPAVRFVRGFFKSQKIARTELAQMDSPVVIGIGGFIAGPVCRAAAQLKLDIALINVDIVPGKANKLARRWARRAFVQFEQTADYFKKASVSTAVTGCPLREDFDNPQPQKALSELSVTADKKILLILGGSSGAVTVNTAAWALADKLEAFADQWHVVHLTGHANYRRTADAWQSAGISHTILPYCDQMADLMAAADLAIARAGAVSVAEYAASALPTILLPYPHHKDKHQYKNAQQLVACAAAVIVDDLPDNTLTAQQLWQALKPLLEDHNKLKQMSQNCERIPAKSAAEQIAKTLLAEGRRKCDKF